MDEPKKFIALETGHGVYQVYRYSERIDEKTAEYVSHSPERLFTSLDSVNAAIEVLLTNEAD